MRTTLDLDDDVLSAAKEFARARNSSIGAVISGLARSGLRPSNVAIVEGLPIIHAKPGAGVIASEMVNRALDDE